MSEVQHLIHEQKFVIQQDVGEAVLAYRLLNVRDKPGINFYSTYVPPEMRGKGLAEKLVRCGLTWAKSQGLEIQASCWYVAMFIR